MISKGTSVHIRFHVGGMTYVQREDTWGIVSSRVIPQHNEHWEAKKKKKKSWETTFCFAAFEFCPE